LATLNPDPEIRESSSSSCSSSIFRASAPRKEPVFLAIILFRLCDGEILEDDDENEDDFSTSEFRIKQNCGSIPALGYRYGPDRHVGLADRPRQRPFHHLANIRFGVPFVLLERFDADALLDAIERHRSPNLTGRLADYKVFVGLVSSPRWILRPRAEEAIRTTITAIGTANGRSPKTIPDWNLGSETRKFPLPNSEKVNGHTHREHL
jgi:hypothetical protein